VRSPVLPLFALGGGYVSMLEDQKHDGQMDNTVLSGLMREHRVAT
jgi:hypothetical protein